MRPLCGLSNAAPPRANHEESRKSRAESEGRVALPRRSLRPSRAALSEETDDPLRDLVALVLLEKMPGARDDLRRPGTRDVGCHPLRVRG
jgi:hypothetical protein